MENKRLGYWIALSVSLHSLLLLVPLSGSLLLPVRAVDVLLVAPELGGEIAAPQRQEDAVQRRPVAMKTTVRPETRVQPREEAIAADTISPAVSAEVNAVTTVSEAPEAASGTTAGSSSVTASLRREGGGRSGLPGDAAFGAAGGPSFIRQEKPVYPFVAKKLGREGRVVLRLTIDEKGGLAHVEVVEGAGFGFTESALEAVRRSVFAPALRDGRPVLSRAILPVRFTLKSD